MANGFGDKDGTIGGTFLLGYKGKLYSIDSDFQVGIPSLQYDAIGCGAELVLGSLHTTAKFNLDPQERIELSLEAASTFNAGVQGPYVVLKQEYKASEEKPTKVVKKSKSTSKLIKSKNKSNKEVEVTVEKSMNSKKKKR